MPYTTGVKQHFLAQNIFYGIGMVGTCIYARAKPKTIFKKTSPLFKELLAFPQQYIHTKDRSMI